MECSAITSIDEDNFETGDYPEDRNDLLRCQGVCGMGHYIHIDYSGDEPSDPECRQCERLTRGEDPEDEFSGQCLTSDMLAGLGTSNDPTPERSDRIKTAFDTQKELNVAALFGQGESVRHTESDWERINELRSGDCDNPASTDIERACEILSYYQNTALPLTDEELIQIFGVIDTESNTFEMKLDPTQYTGSTPGARLNNLKEKIHSTRGGRVHCSAGGDIISDIVDRWNNDPNPPGDCIIKEGGIDRILSPNHIISQEAYEYQMELLQGAGGNVGGFNFQKLFSGAASSSEFEGCMNSLLGDNVGEPYCEGKSNHDVQGEIASVNNVLELKPCHINYIEDKLKKIAVIEVIDAQECMVILNLSESICEQDVSTKMLEIAYLIFHVIGLDNINLQMIQPGSPEYHQLTRLVDRLTPYIKMAIKKIIDISKHYEENTCGRESTTTHVLERMYIDIFEKSKEVSINFNALDLIPTYLTRDTNIEEFVKTVILMVIAIAAVYVLLMVLNRPPIPVAK